MLWLEDTLVQCFHSSAWLAYFCWPVVCYPDVLRLSALETHTGVVLTFFKRASIKVKRQSKLQQLLYQEVLVFKSDCMEKSSLFGVCNWPNQQNSKIKIKVTGHSSGIVFGRMFSFIFLCMYKCIVGDKLSLCLIVFVCNWCAVYKCDSHIWWEKNHTALFQIKSNKSLLFINIQSIKMKIFLWKKHVDSTPGFSIRDLCD